MDHASHAFRQRPHVNTGGLPGGPIGPRHRLRPIGTTPASTAWGLVSDSVWMD